MALNTILATLAFLSLALLLWQWLAGVRFPLHRRVSAPAGAQGVSLLKPLRGCDAATAGCLRSWMRQQYSGPIQILFGVASADDPVCEVVRGLQSEFPSVDAQLVVCTPLNGANAKVAKLSHLERFARYELLVISDADVKAPPDFLGNVLAPLQQREIGLVNCFYCLSNPSTLALQLEAVAINVDFWSQVLQAQDLKRLDFALGAVMATRRQQLRDIGGWATLANCLADDYQLGNRIALGGYQIALSPVVVECWTRKMGWREVWRHQLRWSRTIRVCQPLPYFFSILANATFWPGLWALARPSSLSLSLALVALLVRIFSARNLQSRLLSSPQSKIPLWLAPLKDVLQIAVWFGGFVGNRIEWAGRRMTLRPDGTLKLAQ